MAIRFLLKRAIAVGVAVLLIIAACLCYLRCAQGAPDLQLWLRFAYMAALDADLSKPGNYSISFEAQHVDPALELEVPVDIGSRVSAEELLAGLQATTELIDSRGEVIYAGRIPTGTPRFLSPDNGQILLAEYGYSGIEHHRVNVTISQPALALKGVPHRLVVRSHHQNSAARHEKVVLRFVGHSALLVAAVILIGVVITSKRKPNVQNNDQGKAE